MSIFGDHVLLFFFVSSSLFLMILHIGLRWDCLSKAILQFPRKLHEGCPTSNGTYLALDIMF